MKKKLVWLKILEIAIQVIPLLLFVCLNFNMFKTNIKATIGLSLIVVIITLLLIFKNAIRRFYQTPGVLKFILTIFVLSGLGLLVGSTLFMLATIELVAVLLSLPIQIWYNYLTKPVTSNEMIDALNKIIEKKEIEK